MNQTKQRAEGGPTGWGGDPLVRVAGVSAALPLSAYYLVARPENVFYEPVSLTGYALGLLALVVPILLGRRQWFRSAVSMIGGALLVTTAFIFVVGPGSLWPIAIALGTSAAAVPIVAGSVVGGLATALVRVARGGQSDVA